MHRKLSPIALAAICAAGCATADDTDWRQALDDVVATELAFAQLARDSTVQHAFLTYLAQGGIVFRPGPTEAQEWLRNNPMPPELSLEWQPAWADVSADGSVGYTTGPWRAGRRGDTTGAAAAGQYVTLWRRSPEGYRAVLDFGTGGEAPGTPPALALSPGPGAAMEGDALAVRESVRLADEDLGMALGAQGMRGWSAYAGPSTHWLRDGGAPVIGVEQAPDDGRGRAFLTLGTDAADSGDLGWSWGEWQPEGEARTEPAGHYLRIWRRSEDGSWRVVLDLLARSG